jgi:ferrous iron transport protein B
MSETRTIAIVGNPNSGKTTVFNGLTGSRQRIGNWPGVTVERKEGTFRPTAAERVLVEPFAPGASQTSGAVSVAEAEAGGAAQAVRIVDLPGIYSLSASSQDEVVARDYLLSGEPDLVIDVVDASNIQRNLFLTLQLIEMKVPVLVVLNMMDVADKNGVSIAVDHLAEHLQCPVVPIVGTASADIERLRTEITSVLDEATPSGLRVDYPHPVEDALERLAPAAESLAALLGADPRWVALSVLDGDPWFVRRFAESTSMSREDLEAIVRDVTERLDDEIDVAIADAKYGVIHGLTRHVTRRKLDRTTLTERVDRVVLNRVVALPVFFAVMYAVFWFTMYVGGAFIDFFDILLGTVFVDGFATLLESIGTPEWLNGLLAGGVGAGLQTVGTFVPIIFTLFLALAVLEDSGYMARAAYVMDRFMRSIGLPGRSFVPMMVGFGCTVPAIMATRTLETPRDRYMTSFMAPFMSCGARLPVYALFAAAFFPRAAGAVVLSLYVVGIFVAILTGFVLKHTLFRGTVSHFVMELPPYHAPRPRFVLSQAWQRLRSFIVRAGLTIIAIVTVLSFVNTIGTDGTIGHDDQEGSVLSAVGRAITPVFAPMGVEEENWPATVGLFTGIFAKEVVVGTLSSLYAQQQTAERPDPSEEEFDFVAGIGDAFVSIPEALAGSLAGVTDPLGTGIVSNDAAIVGEEVGADRTVFARMRSQFTPTAAYAYLLFVLLYIPCVAAIAAAIREMGAGLGWLLVAYTTVVAWSLATLFYQVASGPVFGPVAVAVGLLGALVAGLWVLGRTVFRPSAIEGRA